MNDLDFAKTFDLVGEIGCGNGKNLPQSLMVTKSPIVIANDVSLPLCEIAALQIPQAEVHTGDTVSLPLRDNIFDIVLSIAGKMCCTINVFKKNNLLFL